MKSIRNVVVISDMHIGCQLGLCPPCGFDLDEGGTYHPSTLQKKIWSKWDIFWNVWVPKATRGEPYAVVVNGDSIDGVHHNSTGQISHNLKDQRKWCVDVLTPIVKKCMGRFYFIRGTEAHVGQSGCDEEDIARQLGAIPNDNGQHARWELWKICGEGLLHFSHHIGTTGSNHYESTAVHKELVEAFTESGRWRNRAPDVVIRSHRHRCIETRIPNRQGEHTGYAISFTTAGWQGKSPFAFRIAGGRQALPQFGGSLIRQGDEELHTRHCVWTPERSAPE